MITVGEHEIPWQDGLTVAGVLAKLEDGHRYAVVKLDGKLVSRPHFDTTPVSDHSRIIPIPMIAGG
jgi:thiamine biosynthesis protein ThiS